MPFEKQLKRFLLKACLLDNSGSSESSTDITKYITNIMVKKNFIENSFPLFVINFNITKELRDIIRDNTCDISISLSSYNYNENNGNDNEEDDIFSEESVYETTIRLYEKPFDTTFSANDEDSDDTQNPSDAAPFIQYTVAGVPKELVEKNKNIINKLYSKANTSTVVANILNDTLGDIGMSSLYFEAGNNENVIENILIPPMTPVSAIKYIDSKYALYKNGSASLFFDMNNTYLYNIISKNRVFNRTFLYQQKTDVVSSVSENLPEYDDTQHTLRFSSINAPAFSDSRRIMNDIYGSTATYYSYSERYDIVIRKNSNTESEFEKTRFFWNPGSYKEYESSTISMSDDSRVITLAFNGVDPEYFAPDTLVVVESPHGNISGNYTILDISYIMSTRDHKDFTSSCNMTLRKI